MTIPIAGSSFCELSRPALWHADAVRGRPPHLIRDTPGSVEVAVLEEGDRLWVLPESFGTPPVLPTLLLTDLADLVRCGRKVGLAAQEREPYEQARDALMLLLDDSGGRA